MNRTRIHTRPPQADVALVGCGACLESADQAARDAQWLLEAGAGPESPALVESVGLTVMYLEFDELHGGGE